MRQRDDDGAVVDVGALPADISHRVEPFELMRDGRLRQRHQLHQGADAYRPVFRERNDDARGVEVEPVGRDDRIAQLDEPRVDPVGQERDPVAQRAPSVGMACLPHRPSSLTPRPSLTYYIEFNHIEMEMSPVIRTDLAGFDAAGVIDVHAHVVLAATFGAAEELGPRMGGQDGAAPWFEVGEYRLDGVRYEGSPFMDADLRIERMDAAGIDAQVLSPNPLSLLHFADAGLAAGFCRAHNDALTLHLEGRPRLAGIAALPVQDVGAAVEELGRAAGLGLLGAMIGTDLPRPLDDAGMDPLYEACVRLDLPLFIHPSPARAAGQPSDPSLEDYDLDVVLGFAAQEAIAVARLIYGEVLDRHPGLDICISHGGGSAGFLAPRMAQAARKRPWAPTALRPDGAFEERLVRLWFDTHVGGVAQRAMLTDCAGPGRLVYGTNFAGWDAPDDPAAHRPPAQHASNARRLLRLPT